MSRTFRLAYTGLMSLLLSLLMTLWVTWINLGFIAGFVQYWLKAWLLAWPAAFVCILLLASPVLRLMQKLWRNQT
ncbi:MAG: DUF2798 domain-containing protein [Neisseria sp.]|nr:DUF2798 domain-containing protein [Neisseria sp.]